MKTIGKDEIKAWREGFDSGQQFYATSPTYADPRRGDAAKDAALSRALLNRSMRPALVMAFTLGYNAGAVNDRNALASLDSHQFAFAPDPECADCGGKGTIVTDSGDAETGPMVDSEPCHCTQAECDCDACSACEYCSAAPTTEHKAGCPNEDERACDSCKQAMPLVQLEPLECGHTICNERERANHRTCDVSTATAVHTGRGLSCNSGNGAEFGCLLCQVVDGEEAAAIATTEGTVRAEKNERVECAVCYKKVDIDDADECECGCFVCDGHSAMAPERHERECTKGPMTEEKLETLLSDLLTDGDCEIQVVDTFEGRGVMTRNRGLIVRTPDGSTFQLTIVQDRRSR